MSPLEKTDLLAASEPAQRSRRWRIRCAVQDDVEQVLGLWVAASAPQSITDSAEALCGLLALDGQALLLAEQDRQLTGSLIAAWDGWRASFYRLAVHPAHRRQGVASLLLSEGERRLQARGAVRFTAIVADSDPAASAFWRACGYVKQDNQARFVRNLQSASKPAGCESE